MLKRFVVICLSMLVASVALAPAAFAWAPPAGSLFNNPKGTYAAKYRIQLRVEQAIKNARPGTLVLVTSYLMDRRASADALINARNRGVFVHVVLDGGISSGPAARLKRILNADNVADAPAPAKWGPDQSFAIACAGSCRGALPNQAMHSKFYAFEQTGSAHNVVMVSSANLNKGGAVKGYNDMYTMVDVPETFEQYHRVHDEMAADLAVPDQYRDWTERSFESRVFPKKGVTRTTDPTYLDMSKVRCHGATGGAGRNGRTVIKVGMFHWAGERGVYLARKLLGLQRDGCIVSAIYGAPGTTVADMLKAAARRGAINLYDTRVDRNGDGAVDLRIHSKYMLISGNWGGDTSAWHVFAGSQNWTDCSVCGDENTIHVNLRSAYAAYSDNFEFVARYGARRIR